MATGCALRRAVVEQHVLEQERGPAAGALHAAVGDLGDLEPRAHRVGDAHELAELVDGLDEFAEVVEGHGAPSRDPSVGFSEHVAGER